MPREMSEVMIAAQRTALALLLIAVCVLATPPATMLDDALATASVGRLRVLSAHGSLWRGQGLVASVARDGHVARPCLAVAWETDFGELAQGGIAWQLSEGGRQILRLRLSPAGIELSDVRLEAPLGTLLAALPDRLARAGWRGWLQLTSPAWRCGWQGQCHGEARLLWSDAAVDILPGERLGDYEIIFKGINDGGEFGVRTLAGQPAISAQGGWRNGSDPHFVGEVRGRPIVVSRLPAMMYGIASPTADPSRVLIELR